MELKLTEIYNKLKYYFPDIKICSNNESVIRTARLIEKDQNLLEYDSLYVGKISDFSDSLPEDGPFNILCITNRSIPVKYCESKVINTIVLNTEDSIVSVFNKVQDIFTDFHLSESNYISIVDSLIAGKGIQHIIDHGHNVIGNPIYLVDPSFKLIAYSQNCNIE